MELVVVVVLAALLGCASSLLPGPCNLAIVDGGAHAVDQARVRATALGGAFGDLVYATLGAVGVGAVLAREAAILYACSGALMIALGVHRLCVPPDPVRAARACGFMRGASLVLSNPGVLLTWGVVVTTLAGAASPLVRGTLVLAISAGSYAGFRGVGRLQVARRRAVRTGISGMLLLLGVTSLVRAAGVA